MPYLTSYKVTARIVLDVVDEMGRPVVSLSTTGASRESSADGLTSSAAGAIAEARDLLTLMTDAYRAGDTDAALAARRARN